MAAGTPLGPDLHWRRLLGRVEKKGLEARLLQKKEK